MTGYQPNSDTVYQETASDPTGGGLRPKDCPNFTCQSQARVVTCASDELTTNPDPLLGFSYIARTSQSLLTTSPATEGYDLQPDEEIH